MASAPPATLDPAQILPPRRSSRSLILDVSKVFVGALIALLLAAILAVLLFVPNQPGGVDLRQSNEEIARLQREQQIRLEHERQEHVENITAQHRADEQQMERQRRELELFLLMEKLRRAESLEEKRFDLIKQEHRRTEYFENEKLHRESEEVLAEIMQEIVSMKQPLDLTVVQWKTLSGIRRLQSPQKSMLISFLYKLNLLHGDPSTSTALDLQGTDLKDLNLNRIEPDDYDQTFQLDYSRLSLAGTNLINATFEKIRLNDANFSFGRMPGASFRRSEVQRADFRSAKLSLSDFSDANVAMSLFMHATIVRATFANANLYQAQMTQANLASSNFQYANLIQARLDNAVIVGANFYFARAMQANFSRSYMVDCVFQWADLRLASFRLTSLNGANFDTANVLDADFTRAVLVGANISPGQLNLVLSIANALLPDGSIGKNPNLIRTTDGQCADSNNTILNWISTGLVTAPANQSNQACAFQAKTINATLQQTIDIRRYRPLLEGDQGRVHIEMKIESSESFNPNAPPVYMDVRFLDPTGNANGPTKSTLGVTTLTPPSTFIAKLSCPTGTAQLQLNIVFTRINTTVSNIYVTIE